MSNYVEIFLTCVGLSRRSIVSKRSKSRSRIVETEVVVIVEVEIAAKVKVEIAVQGIIVVKEK